MTETAIVPKQETGMTRVKNYLLSPEVKERFTEMMGRNAIYYLNQVLIVVANSDRLQACDPKSILIAAMRAASLQLSVDPGQGQAWIIPYGGKATLQVGYRGIYELAMRTNQYRAINVATVYEGETVTEDRLTGMHTIDGHPTSAKVLGYMLYFELVNGFRKTFYMTVQEIEEHAAHYSASYNDRKSPWNSERERPKMMKKTVLSNGLRKWGRFNTADAETLEAIEEDQGWIGNSELPEESAVTHVEEPKQTPEQIMNDLYGPGTAQEPEAPMLPDDVVSENEPEQEQQPEPVADTPPTKEMWNEWSQVWKQAVKAGIKVKPLDLKTITAAGLVAQISNLRTQLPTN